MSHSPSKIALVGALVAAIACVGCSTSSDEASSANGGGGNGGKGPSPAQLAFDETTTVTLVPGEVRELELEATPPDAYPVRFSLLGDYKDASLDKSEVVTDSSGHASVFVTAPSAATTFRVRASVSGSDSVSTEAGISVSASGFGTLQVNPSYSGKRTVSYWTASVRTGTTCAELSANLQSDGDLKGTAPAGQVPQIDGVPVGPALAVTIRGAYSVAGCKDFTDFEAGEVNQITVEVKDLPMKLTETDLVVTLGLDAQKADLSTLLDSTDALGAIAGTASDDVDALLDAMQEVTPDSTTLGWFDAARISGAWDQALVVPLGGPGIAQKSIRSLVAPWLLEGAASLPGSDTFQGRLTTPNQVAGYALLTIDKVATASADEAGLADLNLVPWQGQPDDTVALGATLFFVPSRLATALALVPAQKSVPSASSVPEAISMLLSCETVAQTLVMNGTAPGSYAFEGCGEACVQSLCQSALELIWQKARDASTSGIATTAKLQINASGDATVDDFARPTSFTGSWLGALELPSTTLSVGGPASGATPPPPS